MEQVRDFFGKLITVVQMILDITTDMHFFPFVLDLEFVITEQALRLTKRARNFFQMLLKLQIYSKEDTIRAFSLKINGLFSIFKKGQGRSPCHPSSCAPELLCNALMREGRQGIYFFYGLLQNICSTFNVKFL